MTKTLTTFRETIEASREELHKNKVGVAYCVRKGEQRQHEFINEDAICIDGRSMRDVIKILKR